MKMFWWMKFSWEFPLTNAQTLGVVHEKRGDDNEIAGVDGPVGNKEDVEGDNKV